MIYVLKSFWLLHGEWFIVGRQEEKQGGPVGCSCSPAELVEAWTSVVATVRSIWILNTFWKKVNIKFIMLY